MLRNYWLANRGGLYHRRVRRQAMQTPASELRRDLPPELAVLPDGYIPEAWVAWQLLRRGKTLADVIRLLELPTEISDAVHDAYRRQPSRESR